MWKSRSLTALAVLATFAGPAGAEGDAAQGEQAFRVCGACHGIGEGAIHKVGPQLNGVVGRAAAAADGYRYSHALIEKAGDGLVWTEESLATFILSPTATVPGTKMTFAGVRGEDEVANLIAYLSTFDESGKRVSAAPAAAAGERSDVPFSPLREGGVFGLGREATTGELAAWDIDVRPDGTGLPPGSGTVAEGEEVFAAQCASCHGDFGEGIGRWPVLAGGFDSLTRERPEKTVGSYWPYASTLFDYIRRAMPYGNARSLTDDEVYALTAYVLYLNDIVTDEEFALSADNYGEIVLPNVEGFVPDDRLSEPHYAARGEPCVTDCKTEPARIVMRAAILDVTPEGEGVGGVD